MKRIENKFFLVGIFITGSVILADAQSNNLKLNIISPAVKTFNVQYERKLSKDASFQLGFFHTNYVDGNDKMNGYGITPEYRIYLSEEREAINGMYLAPYLRYQNFDITDDGVKGTFSSIGGGLIFGRQWVFKKKITLDMFVGPSFTVGNSTNTNNDTFPRLATLDGYGIRAGICFGVAF